MSTVIDDLGGDGLDFDGEHSANEYVPSPEELQSVENIDWEDFSLLDPGSEDLHLVDQMPMPSINDDGTEGAHVQT